MASLVSCSSVDQSAALGAGSMKGRSVGKASKGLIGGIWSQGSVLELIGRNSRILRAFLPGRGSASAHSDPIRAFHVAVSFGRLTLLLLSSTLSSPPSTLYQRLGSPPCPAAELGHPQLHRPRHHPNGHATGAHCAPLPKMARFRIDMPIKPRARILPEENPERKPSGQTPVPSETI